MKVAAHDYHDRDDKTHSHGHGQHGGDDGDNGGDDGEPHKPKADLSRFYVVAVISNPIRYKRRYELYWKFLEMIQTSGVKVITVEQAFGDRPFMVTDADNPYHVQFRSSEILWLKEQMVNLGIRAVRQLDINAREVAWIDADCFPMSISAYEWLSETWHALQQYEVVQMWKHLIDFGPQNQVISGTQLSFMATYIANGYQVPKPNGPYDCVRQGAPGLAWAANIDAIDKLGGVIDICILGAGDWHMANALVGNTVMDRPEMKLTEYAKYINEWQERAVYWLKKNIGVVNVSVGHWFHGNKNGRQYLTRGKILIDNKYDPNKDIKCDSQGMYQLETRDARQIRLRDQIMAYFQQRNEDSIDLK